MTDCHVARRDRNWGMNEIRPNLADAVFFLTLARTDIADAMVEAAREAGQLMKPEEVEELEELAVFSRIMRETLRRSCGEK